VVSEHLLHTALLLGFLFQSVQVLQEQIDNRVRWLKVKWQGPMSGQRAESVDDAQLEALWRV